MKVGYDLKVIIRAYLDNNLGDDLMLNLLFQRFPEYTFYLYTNSSVVKHTFQKYNNVIIRDPSQMISDAKVSDAFITIGGSIFQLVNLRQHASRIMKILFLKYLKMRKKKIVTIGANIGPLSNKFSYKLVEWEIRQNSLTTVRDTVSLGIIEKFKKVNNFYQASDIVYNLDLNVSTEKRGLGISTYRQSRGNDNNIDVYTVLAKIADAFIEKTGEPVKLFSFDSETENDLSSAYHIYELSNYKQMISIEPYLGNQENFLEQFKSCNRMIAIRFHSAILSDICKIPFFPIIYSNKLRDMLNDLEYSGPIIDIKNLDSDDDVDQIVEEIIKGNNLYLNEEKHQNAYIHFDELEKILNSIEN